MTFKPTEEQSQQCVIVQQEVIETINRLAQEGIDYRVIMAGLSSASAAVILQFIGPDQVSVWFARQSAMTMHLASPKH